MVCNCSRAVWKYRRHLDSCDISYKSDGSDSSASRQEQTCLQVCISNRHYLGFSGPLGCAVLAIVSFFNIANKGRHSTDPWPTLYCLDIFPTPQCLQNMLFIAFRRCPGLPSLYWHSSLGTSVLASPSKMYRINDKKRLICYLFKKINTP